MKKIFTSSFFMLMASSLLAQTVSVNDAQKIAEKFLNRSGVATRADVPLKYTYTSAQGDETYYHVFNQGDGQGFIIIGGDAAAREVLGYSDKGSFDYDNMPASMRWWLSQYDNEISQAIREVKESQGSLKKEVQTRASRSNISPMLTTQWDQVAPFNSQIPTYQLDGLTGDDALATGCVATAGAQLMKYYNWPDSGVGSKTMGRTINGHTFGADFQNTVYDWSSMTNTYAYDSYTGSASDVAVGTLMYHIGVAIDMTYGQIRTGGSSGSTKTLAVRLADTFKYDKGLSHEQREFYTDDQWEDLIYTELSEGRPVIYGGETSNHEGHAFVCDGYQDGRWHINWGWSGHSDGFFLLTATAYEKALAPEDTGAGGAAANSSYSCGQEAIIGVKPDYSGISVNKKTIYMSESFTMEKASFDSNERTYIDGLMWNGGLTKETFHFGVMLVNIADNSDVVTASANNTLEIDVNQGSGYVYFNIPSGVTAGATYRVYPLYQDENGTMQVVKTAPGFTFPTISISAPGGIALEKNVVVNNSGYPSITDLNISFSIKNYSPYTQTKEIVLWVFPAEGGSNVDYFYIGDVTLASGEEKAFAVGYYDLAMMALSSGGNYIISLMNYTDGEYISGDIELNVGSYNSLDEIESASEDVKAYDVFGRKVDRNTKGLLIINGKKRIVR